MPVWDRFVRLFHWSIVALVLLAWSTTDGPRAVHEDAGYAVLVLVALRLAWGLMGTPYARFVGFVHRPRTVMRYLTALCEGRAPRYLGHNPAGGAMIVVLLTLLVVASGSGWMSQTDAWFGVPWVDRLHHVSSHLLIIMAGIHVAGVIVSSWLHRENLVLAMITGRKRQHSA
ncbi:MAG: cytochrome b/b6 domain-containing protein [Acetobacteraceae bacterium]